MPADWLACLVAQVPRAGMALALLVCCVPAWASTHYVSAQGSDDADGLAPERAWRTLDRVNAVDLAPGDSVLFRRGDVWRGSLRPRSGGEAGHVTYGAYGQGDKPVLMGSVAKSDPGDWRRVEGDLWVTGEVPPGPAVALDDLPPGYPLRWGLHTEGGAVVERPASVPG